MAWGVQWSVALVIFVLVMAGAGYYVFARTLEGGLHVTVPKIEGLSYTEAANAVAGQGLELGLLRPETQLPHPTIPKGHIIAQRPEAGRVVRTGRKVYPTVSMGKDYLRAPELIHRSLEDARQEITQSRFVLGTVARMPHRMPRDTVIAQDPPPESDIPSQGAISLLVSAGSKASSAFMPDLRGTRAEEAGRLMEPYKVSFSVNEVELPGAKEGVVLNQEPAPGTLIFEGQKVTCDVKPSSGDLLAGERFEAVVRHTMKESWHDRDVRVDVIDRGGNRQTVFTKPPAFDEKSMRTYVAGSAMRIPISYVEQAMVEVYADGKLLESYYLKGGEPPGRRP